MAKELENVNIKISGKAVYVAVKEYLNSNNSDEFKKIINEEIMKQSSDISLKVDRLVNTKTDDISNHFKNYWESFIAKPVVQKLVAEAIEKQIEAVVAKEVKKQIEPIMKKEIGKRIKSLIKVDED